jgi:hypothetical protein
MLESLITSKTRLRLLTKFFLNQGTEAYLQQLATEFGESSNGVRLELKRLTKAKLLISRMSGRTILYQANKDHGHFSLIQESLRKSIGIDSVVKMFINRCGDIESAWIIGDYAEGVDSGLIDIVVLGSVKIKYFQELVNKTSRKIERKIRYLVLNPTELNKLKDCLNFDSAFPIWTK